VPVLHAVSEIWQEITHLKQKSAPKSKFDQLSAVISREELIRFWRILPGELEKLRVETNTSVGKYIHPGTFVIYDNSYQNKIVSQSKNDCLQKRLLLFARTNLTSAA
jgi:hypothetical protein